MWENLFNSIDLLGKGMEASWTRNAVIRNNIANAETPNFKSSDLVFESVLADALDVNGFSAKLTREKHINFAREDIFSVQPQIVENTDTSMLMNGNNVDVEAENVKMAQNSLYYNTLLAKMNGELARLKLAVREGK